jgi:hypothetical protein
MINDWLKKNIKSEIDVLMKADSDQLPEIPVEQPEAKGEIGRKAIIDDPYFQHISTETLVQSKLSRISNKTLKDTSLRDWLVSAIIQNRVDTLLRFSREQKAKFDLGYRIALKDRSAEYTKEDLEICNQISSFVYHCGRTSDVPENDKMNFGEYLKLTVRDALTFGYVATEKIFTRAGALHRFRPLPAEQTFLVNKEMSREAISKEVASIKELYKPRSDNDPRMGQELNEQDIDKYKYVQLSYDNRPLDVFGDEDLIFKLFNPQNFADSMGYCYGPLELAIINILNHLNAENYNANFFTHGYAARGVLHLKGTVTQTALTAFRRQFFNSIVGTNNAWRTPIVAGLDEVQWVPMSANARDMEYINFNNHLMRAICTQFQIDPIELGLDFLSSGTGRPVSSSQGGNQQRVEYSRERGLYPVLMFIEDMVNRHIIPLIDPAFADKYIFLFDGYSDETPQTSIALQQAEMTVFSSMNDLLTTARKGKIKEAIADVPMNQTFWALVEKNFTRGEIRERFFGDKDASKRKELQYIPGDPMFATWNQMLLSVEQQKQQMQMQMQQQGQAQQQAQQQAGLQEAEDARNKEIHKASMKQMQAQEAHGVVHPK